MSALGCCQWQPAEYVLDACIPVPPIMVPWSEVAEQQEISVSRGVGEPPVLGAEDVLGAAGDVQRRRRGRVDPVQQGEKIIVGATHRPIAEDPVHQLVVLSLVDVHTGIPLTPCDIEST